jgi:4-alpha-glucanotransferase
LFMTIKSHNDERPWFEWEHDFMFRTKKTIVNFTQQNKEQIEYKKFLQYVFFKQWHLIKEYANNKDIKLIGDLPVYVAMDSSDAWANPDLFQFNKDRQPTGVAGVPPDYFSETGQLWGNPLFNWKYLKKTKFAWWIERIKANLVLCDILRIDHFRGLSAYWSVPYGETTAINGEWIAAPGKALFNTICKKLGKLPIIAEDLGVITSDVVELRETFDLPGMKILQFAFDSVEESSHNFIPHVYDKRFVVYTGTHDNNTALGWYKDANDEEQAYAEEYLQIDKNNIAWSFIRGAWASTANFAIAPLQDILGLGSEGRMNTPGVLGGNWGWRFKQSDLSSELAKKLNRLTKLYGRK